MIRGRRVNPWMTFLLALALLAVVAPAADASSIVFIRKGNVWLMAPDGSRLRQVTRGGGYSSPSQSDNGVIVALHKRRLVRLKRNGKRIGKPVKIIGSEGRQSGNYTVAAGPGDARVSPDGKKVAYWFGSLTQRCSPVTGICEERLQDNVAYTKVDRFTDPQDYGLIRDYREPSWITNSQTMLFNYGLATTVAIDQIGAGEADLASWFSDPDGAQLGMGVMPAVGSKLALLAGTNRTGPTQETIRLYDVQGTPPVARPVCEINSAVGGAFAQPTWEPNGSSLAWVEGNGIHVASIPDLTPATPDCASIKDRLLIGASEPFWGPKNVGRRDGLRRGRRR